jgi:hypothetical protein
VDLWLGLGLGLGEGFGCQRDPGRAGSVQKEVFKLSRLLAHKQKVVVRSWADSRLVPGSHAECDHFLRGRPRSPGNRFGRGTGKAAGIACSGCFGSDGRGTAGAMRSTFGAHVAVMHDSVYGRSCTGLERTTDSRCSVSTLRGCSSGCVDSDGLGRLHGAMCSAPWQPV